MLTHQHPAKVRALLQKRAELVDKVRLFMRQRDILEVDTPVFNRAGVTDPNISNISLTVDSIEQREIYLGASPEFYMKRLLVAGSGPIYQICKVFRNDPVAKRHQPEFTMLEWYRPNYDHMDLMAEIDELLLSLGLPAAVKKQYREVFMEYLPLDPFTAEPEELLRYARLNGLQVEESDLDILLDFLFSYLVIPELDPDTPLFIYHYPACQAALARLSRTPPVHAERFELFFRGMELANGFHELCDANEQKSRFENENCLRLERGLKEIIIDLRLLQALEQGMPDCAGVAIGLERLLMTVLEKDQITDVMTFPFTVE